jgi:hypothetical protein
MQLNRLGALRERFLFPTSAEGRRLQATRMLFACPGEGALTAVVNLIVILWKNILISFYKVDLENKPFDPEEVWFFTLKRFADLALAQAHEARTLQLRAIGSGEPPISLNKYKLRLDFIATLDEDAKLTFSKPFHDFLLEHKIDRHTINSPAQTLESAFEQIKTSYTRWVPETKIGDDNR